MKRISLISNSSIQYHKFEAEINLDFAKSNKVFFHQPFDSNILDFTLDPLFKVSNDGDDIFDQITIVFYIETNIVGRFAVLLMAYKKPTYARVFRLAMF